MKVYNMESSVFLTSLAEVALDGHKGEQLLEMFPELGYVTTEQAMELLGVTLQTLDKYRTIYLLPAIKGGRRVYYKLADIQHLLNVAAEEGKALKYRRFGHE
jgi:hypothetical protein